mgnify:CR=1 FL=1
MAEDTMFGNIFDVKAEENAEIRSRALSTAQLQPGRASVYGASQAGGMLMQNLAEMAGMKTVKQEKTELVTSIMQEASKLDMNDPKSSLMIAQRFNKVGLTGLAQRFSDQARTRTVKNREMNLNDDKFAETKRSNKEVEKYRTGVLGNSEDQLEFNIEKEETRKTDLANSLNITAQALTRAIAAGKLEEVEDKNGNIVFMQSTVDENGIRSMVPFTKAMANGTFSGDDIVSIGGNEGVAGAANNSELTVNSDGAIISKPFKPEGWTTAKNQKFEAIWDQYKVEYHQSGSNYDIGTWQLTEAQQEAGLTEVPSIYEFAQTLGTGAASIVDEASGGDKLLEKLQARDEAIRQVAIIKDTNTESLKSIKNLSETYGVSETKLKEIPPNLGLDNNGLTIVNDGLSYASLILLAKNKNNTELMEHFENLMMPEQPEGPPGLVELGKNESVKESEITKEIIMLKNMGASRSKKQTVRLRILNKQLNDINLDRK